jgi:hypothetical protein
VSPLKLIPHIGPYGVSHKIMTLVSSNSSDRTEENCDKPRESQLWSASHSNTGPAKEKSYALTFDFICRVFSAFTQCGRAMNTHYAMNSAQVRMCVNDTGRWTPAKSFPVFARIWVRQGQRAGKNNGF